MTQIISDQVNNKITPEQIKRLSDTMRIGTALNTNPDRENANGAIFLNNMLKEIVGKDLLTFIPAPDHKGLELPQFNWSRANKLLPEKTKEQKHHIDIRSKAKSIAVLQRIRPEFHKTRMDRERKLASTRQKGHVPW